MIADPFAPSDFSLGLLRTAGWRFTVSDHLAVTHLGLYDWQADGLQMDYEVGLWNSAGDLLTTTSVPGGQSTPYISGFRYATTSVAFLSPGEVYTIGYHQRLLQGADRAIYFDGFHSYDSLVTQVGAAVISDASDEMTMPNQPWPTGFQYWIGAGFQYTIVPAPGSVAACALLLLQRRRRRRDVHECCIH